MNGSGTMVLHVLGWAMLIGGALGLVAYVLDQQPALGAACALSGIMCWASFTTAASFIDHAAAKLERIEANTKRSADALEQGLR